MYNSSTGLLVVVSGPSGVGKGTICAALKRDDPDICYSVSVTTRAPRRNEKDGVHYHFISHDEFLAKIDRGEFLEYAQVYGNYYGTLKSDVDVLLAQGKNVILEIDTQGAMQVKKTCKSGVFVFILPPSFTELCRRIKSRGTETQEALELRLSQAEKEMSLAGNYDYTIVNERIDRSVAELRRIISCERAKREGNIIVK